MFATLKKLLEMIRFSHTIFALPFAFLAAALAWKDEPIRWQDALGILLCMVFARSFAMAFNRLADRHFDARNPRTAGRHLPSGTLSVATVTAFMVLNAVLFLAATLLFLFREPPNLWPLYLAGPVLAFVAMYSLTKRFTLLAHFWLGASLMLAPVAAWIAVKGLTAMPVPLLLGGAVFFWVSGFDILYACQDFAFDKAAGLHSVPAKLGVPMSLRIAALCHAIMLVFLVAVGLLSPHLHGLFFVGLGVVALLLLYEHWLVRPDDLSRVNRAFFQVNAVVSIGLFTVVLLELSLN